MGSKRKIGVFDIETDPFKHERIIKPFASGFYDGVVYRSFWGKDCIEKILPHMLKFKGIIYAHNGGRFDFHYLLRYITGEIELFRIKNRLAKINYKGTEFRDSFCILPIPFKATGEKDDIELWKLEKKHREKYKKEILSYLKQDCKGLHEVIIAYIEKFGLGLTLANRAFAQLRKFGYKITNQTEHDYKRFRPFYFGGRCECFDSGYIKGDFSYIDINSAYPFAMLMKHWHGNQYIRTKKLPKIKKDINPCFIELIAYSEGALPLREKNNSVSFPHGRNRFYVTGWELVAGIETGTVKIERVILVYRPFNTESFTPFINHFYEQKLKAEREGNKLQRLFNKLMQNSAYGRFAFDPRKCKESCLTLIGEKPKQTKEDIKENGKFEFVTDIQESDLSIWERLNPKWYFYNVATAASITGCVRSILWKSMCKTVRPVYCDTDSIICEGHENLSISDMLGDWKIEATGKEVWIAGKKLYAFKTDDNKYFCASKGVNLPPDDIKKVALKEVVRWDSDAPTFKLAGTEYIKREIKFTAKISKQK